MTEPPRVVVTGPWLETGWDAPLRAAGCSVAAGPSIDERPGDRLDESALRELCADADAILVSSREVLTGSAMDAAPRLRIVAKATIGVERIDLAAATARGVLVVNSPAPENFVGLAEGTVGLIVALAKRLLEKEARIASGGWRDASTDGQVLAGRTVGIVGLGRVGSRVARRLAGWEVNLVGYDPYIPAEQFDDLGVRAVTWRELLERSDVLTLHVPLTAETRGMIGDAELARLPDGALLVNTSRGPVVDESAVAEALMGGSLGAAALDVFEEEPLPPDSPLRRVPRDRLLLTPHSIGSSRASRMSGTRMATAAILAALAGRVPPNVVNDEVVDRWRDRWESVTLAGSN